MLETILTIVFAILTIVGSGLAYYFYVKDKITAAANDAVNTAEDSNAVAQEKMEIAIIEIEKILPAGAKVFFTKERIRVIVQAAFDGIELYAQKQANKNK